MLTADQILAIKKLIPKVKEFLERDCSYHCLKDEIKARLEETLTEGYCTGMIKMELFCIENVEGLRVQYGNAHKYFRVKAEGPMSS